MKPIYGLMILLWVFTSCVNEQILFATISHPMKVYEHENSERVLVTIPAEKSFRVKKKKVNNKKGCWSVYSKDAYVGVVCDPTFVYIGSIQPNGYDLYNNHDFSTQDLQKSSGVQSSDHTIHTGPKGGKYYINSNGNKTYIKKKN